MAALMSTRRGQENATDGIRKTSSEKCGMIMILPWLAGFYLIHCLLPFLTHPAGREAIWKRSWVASANNKKVLEGVCRSLSELSTTDVEFAYAIGTF
jgi:hypothetical protein